MALGTSHFAWAWRACARARGENIMSHDKIWEVQDDLKCQWRHLQIFLFIPPFSDCPKVPVFCIFTRTKHITNHTRPPWTPFVCPLTHIGLLFLLHSLGTHTTLATQQGTAIIPAHSLFQFTPLSSSIVSLCSNQDTYRHIKWTIVRYVLYRPLNEGRPVNVSKKNLNSTKLLHFGIHVHSAPTSNSCYVTFCFISFKCVFSDL